MYSRMVRRFVYGMRVRLTNQECVMGIVTEVRVGEDGFKEMMMMEGIDMLDSHW